MAAQMKLDGVDELLAELGRLAPDLTAETRPLQASQAAETAAALRAAYPAVTGGLRASVTVRQDSSRSPSRLFTEVAVTAPYVEYYEFGTSRTTPHPTFVPITNRGRKEFLDTVIGRVRARGLKVGGSA